MKRLPKSGNITIKLSSKEVERLLKDSYFQNSVISKLRKAVRSKFSNVDAEIAEERRVSIIVFGLRDSEEWRTISDQLYEERQKLNKQYDALSRKESEKFQELAQAKLDEAGVKSFKAKGHGFIRVEEAKDVS